MGAIIVCGFAIGLAMTTVKPFASSSSAATQGFITKIINGKTVTIPPRTELRKVKVRVPARTVTRNGRTVTIPAHTVTRTSVVSVPGPPGPTRTIRGPGGTQTVIRTITGPTTTLPGGTTTVPGPTTTVQGPPPPPSTVFSTIISTVFSTITVTSTPPPPST